MSINSSNAPLALRADAPVEKRCSRCTKVLPLSSFYGNANKPTRYSHYCINCEREYMAEYRQRTKERRSEYMREWNTTPKGKESQQRDGVRLRKQRPEVLRARRLVNYAISRGDLVRRPCQFCGNENSQAHHYDYSEPLSVIWACFVCHREMIHGHKVVAKDTAP